MRNDSDVVSAPREGQSLSYRNIVYGTLLVLVGIAGLIVGVSTNLIVVGVIAFVVMVAGVVLAVAPGKGRGLRPVGGTRKSAPSSSTSFMDRMNDRWDKRREGH